jgi:hypothetical protein
MSREIEEFLSKAGRDLPGCPGDGAGCMGIAFGGITMAIGELE